MKQNSEIKVSVIMGVYNQWNKDELYAAVYSILEQSLQSFEFIIYDDGSDSELARTIKKLEELDKRIIVIRKEENHGLAFSLNTCIQIARGKYIARMDADDVSVKNRLEVQYNFLENHPEYSWCGCNAELFDENGIWGTRQMPEKPVKEDYLKYSPYIHPSVMYRSQLFEKEDAYLVSNDTLRCEDYEIFMRLRNHGYYGYNIQSCLFRYREDRHSFQKRKFCYRISEAKIRYRNFKDMGILFPIGWIYCLRPIIGGVLPVDWIRYLKRKESALKRPDTGGTAIGERTSA